MMTLTWKPISLNLREALGELNDLNCYLHFLVFGDVPDGYGENERKWLEKLEANLPFSEMSLHVSLDHAYHHINFAWNTRRTPEERAWHATNAFDRWSRFPKTRDFADLRTDVNGARRPHHMEPSAHRKVNASLVREHILTARRELEILCWLVTREIGEDSAWSVPPEGVDADLANAPLSEREFARRMHAVYAALNLAWNSRRLKKRAATVGEIRRRQCFSPMFMPGILVK